MNLHTIAVTTEGIVHGTSIRPRNVPRALILLFSKSAIPMPNMSWITTTSATKTKVFLK